LDADGIGIGGLYCHAARTLFLAAKIQLEVVTRLLDRTGADGGVHNSTLRVDGLTL
jgi:hypothetical protein